MYLVFKNNLTLTVNIGRKSQSHRMARLEETCEDHRVQPPAEQDHSEHVAHDGIQAGFEYPHRRRLRNLSGQPIPVLSSSVHFREQTAGPWEKLMRLSFLFCNACQSHEIIQKAWISGGKFSALLFSTNF